MPGPSHSAHSAPAEISAESRAAFDAAIRDGHSQKGRSLAELSADRPVLVLFIRHAGCTFCREALSDLQRQRSSLEQRGLGLAIVHMGGNTEAAAQFARYGLDDVDRFSDPERRLYQAFELPLGTLRQLLGLRVWFRGFLVALLKRHGFGSIRGNVFQMPGAFLLHRGKIIASHRHRRPSERVDFTDFACAIAPTE